MKKRILPNEWKRHIRKSKEKRRSRNFYQLTPIGRVLIDSLRSRNSFVFLVVSALQLDSWHGSKKKMWNSAATQEDASVALGTL